jgi:hypothetical protein
MHGTVEQVVQGALRRACRPLSSPSPTSDNAGHSLASSYPVVVQSRHGHNLCQPISARAKWGPATKASIAAGIREPNAHAQTALLSTSHQLSGPSSGCQILYTAYALLHIMYF